MESQDSREGKFKTVCPNLTCHLVMPAVIFHRTSKLMHVAICKVHKATFRLPEAGGGVQDREKVTCKNILIWSVLPMLCNIFHVKIKPFIEGPTLSRGQGAEYIKAKNAPRRFREWSKCSMHMWKRCFEAKGLVEFLELLDRLEGSKSIVGDTRLPHFMDRIGPLIPLIGFLSPMICYWCSCRFERIDT